MTTIRRSGRVRCRRLSNASARSLSRWRSWNSSSITAETPFNAGSEIRRRVSTPSVTKRNRVRALIASSNRTWYPTLSPTCSPISQATRRADKRAAMRRGSSTTTSPVILLSKSRRHAGRLARTRGRLDLNVRAAFQRVNDLRQDCVYRMRGFVVHQLFIETRHMAGVIRFIE